MGGIKGTCSYGRFEHNDGGSRICQFVDELDGPPKLYEINGVDYCIFHMPYAQMPNPVGDGLVTLASNVGKQNWSYEQCSQFNEDILKRLSTAYKDEETCDLTGVIFPSDVSFDNIKMPKVAFDKCDFAGGDVYFRGALFSGGDATFRSTLFSGGSADFTDAQFSGGNADFGGAQFSGGAAEFFNTRFSGGYADFSSAQFSGGGAFFDNAQFSGRIVFFRDTKFSGGDASFIGTQFSDERTFFDGAQFSDGDANFSSARFSGKIISFHDAEFSGGYTFFEDTQFSGGVYFNTDQTSEEKSRSNNTFNVVRFSNAKFSAEAEFNNRVFLDQTNFTNTTFSAAPKFHGCELHQDTIFPSIDHFTDTSNPWAAHAYRTLRLAMKQQEAHEEEAMFWALEQRSKRNNLNPKRPKNWLPWTLSWGYDILSNYGLNAGLPARWLGGWVVYSTVIYACVAGSLEKLANPDHWLSALEFSIAQMARPFFIWGDYDGADIKAALGSNELNFLIKMLATVDSIVSLTLIALFILAVRRRFRMQ